MDAATNADGTGTGRPPYARWGAEYAREVAAAMELVSWSEFERTVLLLARVRAARRRVYACGNGGSATTASHLACDLGKTITRDGGQGLRVVALSDLTGSFSAWANDLHYDEVFAQQLALFLEPGDAVIAVSASGRSPNILRALAAAGDGGATTVALTGFDGGPARQLADIGLHVPVHDYGVVESVHLGLVHALTAALLRDGAGRPALPPFAAAAGSAGH